MLFVLSPAKALDFDSPAPSIVETEVLFGECAAYLVDQLKTLAPQDIASLMRLSEKLALLNSMRYAQWQADASTAALRKQAIFAFNGDVYAGLQAQTLSNKALAFAQEHLCILSGLYGVLRPLDVIQPYRLEMGSALHLGRVKNLYQYWNSTIVEYLNTRLEQDPHQCVLINLASQEYFKVVDCKTLQAPVLECVFQDYKNGVYKVIGFFAKRARGRMARFILENALTSSEDLKFFAEDGYAFQTSVSSARRFVFQRRV